MLASHKVSPALTHTVYFKAICACRPVALGALLGSNELTASFSRFDFGSVIYPLTGINASLRWTNLKTNFK